MTSERRLAESEQKRKEAVVEALRRYGRVDEAAESLGLGVRRMYRWMKRYGLTLKGVLGWPSLPPLGKSDASSPGSKDEKRTAPQAGQPQAQRDARRLTARDFTGASLGDTNGPANGVRSAEELLTRYCRLRGK